MKKKMNLTKKAERLINWAMWIIMIWIFYICFFFLSEAKAVPIRTIQTEISSKNPEVRKYHRKNKRGRKCSLCRKKLWKRI
jgi:sigma54-dependent transcription regulator